MTRHGMKLCNWMVVAALCCADASSAEATGTVAGTVELGDVIFVRWSELPFDAGIVEEAVDTAEGLDGGLGVTLHVGLFAAIRDTLFDLRARRAKRIGALGEPGRVDVDHQHPGALAREDLAGSEADGAGSAGHDD